MQLLMVIERDPTITSMSGSRKMSKKPIQVVTPEPKPSPI